MSLYIALVNSILALVMIIYNWNINRNSIFLGFLILSLSSYLMVGYIVTHSQSRYLIALSYAHFAPLWYLSPTLVYIYIRGTIEDRVSMKWKDLFHLIPFIISLVGLFPYLILPFQSKLDFADEIIKNINAPKYIKTNWILSFETNLLLRPLLIIIYSSYCIGIIRRAKKVYLLSPLVPKRQWQFIQRWMLLLTSTLILISIPALLISIYYIVKINIDASLIRDSIFFYMIDFTQLILLVVLILFPQIIYGVPISSRREILIDAESKHIIKHIGNDEQAIVNHPINYAKDSKLDPDPFFELGERVLKVMEEDKPYLNVDFSLDDLADILGVPKHHLYYCFQNILYKKFTRLRTEFRIEHAKKLLLESDFRSVTVDSVGQDSGFASKSAFYSVFKTELGCSPGEYTKANNSIDSKK